MFWILIVIAVMVIAAGAYVVATLPQLRVHNVSAHVDSPLVSISEVLTAARIDRTANAWIMNTGAIEKRIEAIPYVRTARISRSLPADLSIEVTTRVPVACVRTNMRVVTIDDAPRIVQNDCVDASLARIDIANATFGEPGAFASDPAIAGLLSDSRVLADAHIAVVSVSRDRFGGLVALDKTGVAMLFGSDADLGQKAALINPIRASLSRDHRVKSIDVRAPATPIIDFK